MKLKIGDLICVERKQKDQKKRKWKIWSNIYIVFTENKAMRFRAKKPVEIKINKEIEKGYRIQKVRANIADMLDYWNVKFDMFWKEFLKKMEQ